MRCFIGNRFPLVPSRKCLCIDQLCASILAILLTFASSGCSGPAVEAEEDHEHHELPAHRPRDLPSASAEVRARWVALPISGEQDSAVRHAELADILRWLPEIAGESELDESSWNDVSTLAAELTTIFARKSRERPFAERDAERAVKLFDTLDHLASRAGMTIYGRSRDSVADSLSPPSAVEPTATPAAPETAVAKP